MTTATKALVDRAMAAFEQLDQFGKGLTARLYGVKAAEGSDGMRAAFTRSPYCQVSETVSDLEYEIREKDQGDSAPGEGVGPKT